MKHTYKISGMTCGNCKATIEKNLNELQNIEDIEVNLEKEEVTISITVDGFLVLYFSRNSIQIQSQ